MLLNSKDKLTSHPKSFDSTLNHHAAEDTAIQKYSKVMHSGVCLTDTHDIPSFKINTPIKGHHPKLGLEASTTGTGRIVTYQMTTGTISCRIHHCRTTIRVATILKLNCANLDGASHFKN